MTTPAGPPVAVVTGAGGGLGAVTATVLGELGLAVACVDIDEVAAKRTATELGNNGVTSTAYGVDVTSESAASSLVDTVHADLGHVSHLVNIAGILRRTHLADTTAGSWRQVMDVNVTAPFLLTQAFAVDLKAAEYGRVINCASFAGTRGYEYPAYAASKAALINLTSSLMFDFWGTAVTVNAVAPGAMVTPMLDRPAAERMAAKTPTGRILDPDDVAAVIGFLAGRTSRGVNGTTTVIDGGASLLFSYK
ncbi:MULTISPECIES: SDR family NAD(P)-dependent oxidoreductase [Rhodococcus]|uniref:Putative oxidoreductase n=1 Tax=Rhodococcus wratislaviensis NBRC 100605 TaxID=1219028 RepID=X0R9K3_RHOWR|nr:MULTISPECIES: SDR family oxidoreductase [Rhodococcus]WAM12483.1 SDR family NAD(P)-dependent oxidoreductase [Rhodococcus sp. JS3073]GAF47685.1 putative oxidoreductase [Rhodococcus wratislaviensis NBRC 100605]